MRDIAGIPGVYAGEDVKEALLDLAAPSKKEMILALEQNTPILRITLEHKGKMAHALAVLDTGAQDIYIPRPIAEHLGYDIAKITKGTKFYGVKGGKTTFPVKIDKMTLRDFKCSAGPVFARTAAFDPLGGYMLLGRPFIRAVGMKIAFDKLKETFKITCSKQSQATKESVGPVRLDDPKTMFRRFTLTVGNKSLTGPCYVDTGATHTLLPLWLAQELGMKISYLNERAQGAAGSFTIMLGRLDRLELDDTPCEAGPMSVIATPHARYPIVGVDFFKATGTVLDFTKGFPDIHCGR